MATYLILATFTEQGIKNIKGTLDRAEKAAADGAKMGVKVKDIYWVQGKHDVAMLCESDNETAATAFSLKIASDGFVRLQTHRAFGRDEMKQILSKVS
jgi:uncharacterized protein with GYD domain